MLVQVAACGICGSDVHGYDGSSGRRIPPIVIGPWRAAGTIAAIGPTGVTGFAAGDRVTFDSTIFCGECAYCLRRQTNLCDHRRVLGVSCDDYRCNGAFAEYVVVPQRILYHLPATLPFQEAAMLEAVSVAMHAVSLSDIHSGDTALVVGAGMIGLLALQALRAAGLLARVCDQRKHGEVEAARRPGSNCCFARQKRNLVREILLHTNGTGVDVTVEAVGVSPTVANAVECTRKGGTVTMVGGPVRLGSVAFTKSCYAANSPSGIVRDCGGISTSD